MGQVEGKGDRVVMPRPCEEPAGVWRGKSGGRWRKGIPDSVCTKLKEPRMERLTEAENGRGNRPTQDSEEI